MAPHGAVRCFRIITQSPSVMWITDHRVALDLRGEEIPRPYHRKEAAKINDFVLLGGLVELSGGDSTGKRQAAGDFIGSASRRMARERFGSRAIIVASSLAARRWHMTPLGERMPNLV